MQKDALRYVVRQPGLVAVGGLTDLSYPARVLDRAGSQKRSMAEFDQAARPPASQIRCLSTGRIRHTLLSQLSHPLPSPDRRPQINSCRLITLPTGGNIIFFHTIDLSTESYSIHSALACRSDRQTHPPACTDGICKGLTTHRTGSEIDNSARDETPL